MLPLRYSLLNTHCICCKTVTVQKKQKTTTKEKKKTEQCRHDLTPKTQQGIVGGWSSNSDKRNFFYAHQTSILEYFVIQPGQKGKLDLVERKKNTHTKKKDKQNKSHCVLVATPVPPCPYRLVSTIGRPIWSARSLIRHINSMRHHGTNGGEGWLWWWHINCEDPQLTEETEAELPGPGAGGGAPL